VGAHTPFDGVRDNVEKIKNKHRLHFYPEQQISENVLVDIVLINDTVPENRRKERYRIIQEENGEKTEFTLEDGKIIELKVNGKMIPEEEFENYEDLVDEMITNIPPPPVPPAPPTPPTPPSAPVPPTPPAPPAAPKAPTSIFKVKTATKQTVTKTKKEDGKTVIVIETDDGKEPMEIVIEKEGNVILIDGNKLEDGDTAIIIDEHNPRFGLMSISPKSRSFTFDSKNIELDKNALLGWAEDAKGENTWAFEDNEGKLSFGLEKEQLAKIKEDQERAIKLYQEQLKAYRNDLQHQSAEMQQLTKKQMNEVNKRLKEMQKLQRIDGDAFLWMSDNNTVQELLFDAKDSDNSYEIYFEGSGRFTTENVSSRIERELVRDGLIDSGSDYKLEINAKGMKVNGKRVSDEVFEKYKSIYERSTHSKMNKRSNLSINKKDD
jgi:hypothetical protein